tara:strand:+ start:294 stop:1010 length:717 start_codon:yes stop_codon:yes gene_type:complete
MGRDISYSNEDTLEIQKSYQIHKDDHGNIKAITAAIKNPNSDHIAREIIMADWEAPIMKKHADIMCNSTQTYGGKDILEIGFGLGLSATYVQEMCDINSHTIIERHPQIAENARHWAKDKVGVKIIESDWWDVRNEFSMYDGIFYDAEYDPHLENFWDSIKMTIKEGGIFTFFSHFGSTGKHSHKLVPEFKVKYEHMDISNITPIAGDTGGEGVIFCESSSEKDYFLPYIKREFNTSI